MFEEVDSKSKHKTSIDFLANSKFSKLGEVASLPNGNAMLTHYKDCEEDSESLRIYFLANHKFFTSKTCSSCGFFLYNFGWTRKRINNCKRIGDYQRANS